MFIHAHHVEENRVRYVHGFCITSKEYVQFYIQIQSSKAAVRDTVVFEGPPTVEQKLWPMHCVQGSWGSELHPDLRVIFLVHMP